MTYTPISLRKDKEDKSTFGKYVPIAQRQPLEKKRWSEVFEYTGWQPEKEWEKRLKEAGFAPPKAKVRMTEDGAWIDDPVKRASTFIPFEEVRETGVSYLSSIKEKGLTEKEMELTKISERYKKGKERLEEMELSEVGRGLVTFAEGLRYLPVQIDASIQRALHGAEGASVVDKTWQNYYISMANEDIERFVQETEKKYGDGEFLPGVKLTDVASLPQNVAYSITSMGAALGVGAPIATIPVFGARAVAYTAGGLASAKVAYEMTSYEIMQEYLELKNAEMIEKEGRGITTAEEKNLKDAFAVKAMDYGLYEAIPEAVGNVFLGGLVFGKLAGTLSKMLGGTMSNSIVTKLTYAYAEELATETYTEMGQRQIRYEAGLPGGVKVDWKSSKSWFTALAAVAPQTFLLTTLMGGAGQTIVSTRQALTALEREIGPSHFLYEKFRKAIDELGRGVQKIPTAMANKLKDMPVGLTIKEVERAKEKAIKKEVAPIPKELEPLAKEARKYKSVEEFKKLLKEEGYKGRVLSGKEKAIIISGKEIKSLDEIKNIVPELQKVGIEIKTDITGKVDVIDLDRKLTSFLEENPKVLTDFYTQAIKEVKPVVKALVPERIVREARVGKKIPIKKVIQKEVRGEPAPFIRKRETTLLKERIKEIQRRAKAEKWSEIKLQREITKAQTKLEAVTRKGELKVLKVGITERLRGLTRGAREGKIATKKEIKEIQTSILNEIDKFDLEAKDKAKFIRTVKNIQTNEQFRKALPEIQERIEKYQHRTLINEIKRELKMPLVTRAGVSKYSPYVTKTLKSFKNRSSFKDTTTLKYTKLEKTYQWLKNNPNETLPDSVIEELDELDRTHLGLLTNKELEEQLLSIKSLKTQGKTYKRLKIEQTKRERKIISDEFIGIITEGKGVEVGMVVPDRKTINNKISEVFSKFAHPIKTISGKPLNTYNLRMLHEDNLFDILDETTSTTPYNGKIHSYFIEVGNKSRDTEIRLNNEDFNNIQNRVTEFGIEGDFSKIVTIDNVKLTRSDLIGIYVSSHDKAQLESMIEGNKFSQEFINKAIAELSSEEKAFGDFVLDIEEEGYYPQNDVYRQVNFMDMPKNKGYSSMHKDLNYVKENEVNVAMQNLEYAKASVPKGQTKIRTGSLTPIKLDIIERLVVDITRKNHYISWELPVKEMNSILSKIKPAIRQEYGDNFYPVLRQWLESVAGDGRYDKTWLAGKLLQARRGFTKALIANFITPIKQTISLSSFLTEMNEIEMAKGLGTYWTNKKAWDNFWSNVPQIAQRSETLTRDIGEISESRTAIDKVMKRKAKSELTVAGVKLMDKLTVRSGATAMYLARGGTLVGDINTTAMNKTLGVVRRTQPTGDIKDLSSLQKGGPLEKLGTMFMNQLNQYYNILYHNIRAYSKGRIGKGQLARAILYTWVVPQIAFEFITSGGTADEEDYLKAIAFGPFKYLLFIGNLFNAAQTGFDYQFSAIEDLPSEMTREIRNILQGDILEGLLGAGEIVAEYKGYPVNQPKRTASGVYDLVTGKTDDWRRLIWSEWALKEKKAPEVKEGIEIEIPEIELEGIDIEIPEIEL